MSSKKYPEQRSAKSAAQQGLPAQPTGEESFETPGAAAGAAGGGTTQESPPQTTAPQAAPGERTERTEPVEGVAQSRAELQALGAEYYEKLSETAANLAGQSAEVFHASTAQVQQRPWTALLSVFGLGLIIGVLSKRA